MLVKSEVVRVDGYTNVSFFVFNPQNLFQDGPLAWEFMGNAALYDFMACETAPVIVSVPSMPHMPTLPQFYVKNLGEASKFYEGFAELYIAALAAYRDVKEFARFAERIRAAAQTSDAVTPPF